MIGCACQSARPMLLLLRDSQGGTGEPSPASASSPSLFDSGSHHGPGTQSREGGGRYGPGGVWPGAGPEGAPNVTEGAGQAPPPTGSLRPYSLSFMCYTTCRLR